MSEPDLEAMVLELRSIYDRQRSAVDTIKDTGRTIFGATSTVVPLISAARLVLPQSGLVASLVPVAYQPTLLVLVITVYAVIMITSISALLPTKIFGPIQPNKEHLEIAYKGKNERELLNEHINRLLNVIYENEKSLADLKKKVTWSGFLLVFDTLLAMALLL